MIINERQQYILDLLKKQVSVKTSDLAQVLNTTRQTIHSDIEALSEAGKLKKVYGGATRMKVAVEPSIFFRKTENIEAKNAIAKMASGCIEEGDTIFLDIGTTIASMIPYLIEFNHLTVVTNSLEVAYHLAKHDHLNLIVTGGIVRSNELSISGLNSADLVNQLYVDKCFIGVGGIAVDAGFTDYHFAEAELRKIMMKQAQHTYALLDETKVGAKAIAKYGELDDVETIIADNIPDQELIEKLQQLKVEVFLTDDFTKN